MKIKPIFTIHDENPQLTAMTFKREIFSLLANQAKMMYNDYEKHDTVRIQDEDSRLLSGLDRKRRPNKLA
jgi:hypothetical protein